MKEFKWVDMDGDGGELFSSDGDDRMYLRIDVAGRSIMHQYTPETALDIADALIQMAKAAIAKREGR